jgi:DNA-binding NarL/FixJ family response regulator
MMVIAKSKMVVIWGGDDLLSTSIEYFLATKEDWKVVSISNKEDLDALLRVDDPPRLDIVIIHSGYQSVDAKIPESLLQNHPTIKVILLSLENNLLEIFSKQKMLIQQSSDLISAIENVL